MSAPFLVRRPLAAVTAALGLWAALGGTTALAAPKGWSFVGGSALVGISDKELSAVEGALGRRVNLVRVYHQVDQQVPNARDRELSTGGRMLHVSVKLFTGNRVPIKYSAIAAGDYDYEFKQMFRELYALPTRVFFTVQHEADADDALGSCTGTETAPAQCGPQFVRAWNHLRQVAHGMGMDDRIFWVWTLTGFAWTPANVERANNYFPGVANIDWIGNDTYDGSCKGLSKDFPNTAAQHVNTWAKSRAPDVPIMVPETGSADPAQVGPYLDSIRSTLQLADWNNWRAIEYWNSGESPCDYALTSNTSGMAGFKRLVTAPYFMATDVLRAGGGPVANITAPASGSTVSGMVSIKVSATDADGVDSVQLRIDDKWISADNAAPWEFSYNTSQLTNGSHMVEVRAYDTKGNMGSDSLTVRVSN